MRVVAANKPGATDPLINQPDGCDFYTISKSFYKFIQPGEGDKQRRLKRNTLLKIIKELNSLLPLYQ